jgi:hypothetical protein
VDDKKPGVFKNSFHLYYTNVYFENNAETCMRPFVKQVLDLSDPLLTIHEGEDDYDINEKEPRIVDHGIYTKNRPFRLPGSHKCGSKQRVEFPSFEDFEALSVVGKTCPPDGMFVTAAMVLKLVPDQVEAASKRKAALKQCLPRELAQRYRDSVCSRIKELLRAKGDTHTDVYLQGNKYCGMTDAQHGRTCLVAGEHNESDNCFFTIRQDGAVYYHCHDSEAHAACACVPIGHLVEEEEHGQPLQRQVLQDFVKCLPSAELAQLKSLLPKTHRNLIHVEKKGDPIPNSSPKFKKRAKQPQTFAKHIFSVEGLCENGDTTEVELDKGGFWGKCKCNHENHAFIGWLYDPTLWTNPDFQLDSEGLENITTVYNERYTTSTATPWEQGRPSS